MSTITKVGTGGKSRLVFICERICVLRADYAIKSAKWFMLARLLRQATLSFIVDVEALVS
jgi:hypothetical protein